MMNKKRILLWVKELVLNPTPQAIGQLRKKDSYCCLGDACEVYRTHSKSPNNNKWLHYDKSACETGFSFLGSRGFLPDKVVSWYGFEKTDVSYPDNPTIGKPTKLNLSLLNDKHLPKSIIGALIYNACIEQIEGFELNFKEVAEIGAFFNWETCSENLKQKLFFLEDKVRKILKQDEDND